MNLKVFVICLVFLSTVVAPPPLDVELRAEKEYMLMKKLTQDKAEDILDVFNDNLIDDSEDDDFKELIEDTDEDISKEFEEDDESDEFVPVSLSGSFDKYDLNNDNFIDKNELISVMGVIENNNLAMEAADSDGDDMLSRDEFEKGPWDLTSDDSDSADDDFDDVTDDVESEIIDFDDDKFDKIVMNSDIIDDSTDDDKDTQYSEDDRDFNKIIDSKSGRRQTEDDDNEIVNKRNENEQQNGPDDN